MTDWVMMNGECWDMSVREMAALQWFIHYSARYCVLTCKLCFLFWAAASFLALIVLLPCPVRILFVPMYQDELEKLIVTCTFQTTTSIHANKATG